MRSSPSCKTLSFCLSRNVISSVVPNSCNLPKVSHGKSVWAPYIQYLMCEMSNWRLYIIFFFFWFSGVLLYGPPGCGKTLIAKATAKASGCRFINLQASTLTDKWYGESQKLTAAVFSLAVKIQPCIIFIDEIGNHWICSEKLDRFQKDYNAGLSNMPNKFTSQY